VSESASNDVPRRPAGSNADEWAAFLADYWDLPNPKGFLAVQIAEALDEAYARGSRNAAAYFDPARAERKDHS
jgi:hypothetical protein